MSDFSDLPAAQNAALKETERVLKEIRGERARQFAEWGWQPNNGDRDLVAHEHDDQHAPGDWTRFIVRHLGRAEQGIEDGDRYRYRDQLLRVAALAVAAIESFDRKDRPTDAR